MDLTIWGVSGADLGRAFGAGPLPPRATVTAYCTLVGLVSDGRRGRSFGSRRTRSTALAWQGA